MASTTRVCLLGDDVESILEETLSDSENSLFDSDDDSSVIEDLPIHKPTAIDGNENEDCDSAQGPTCAFCWVLLVLWQLHGRTWLIM
jgi:hypothetical protein